jgi:ATP-dependent DNA helicase RecQ
VLPRDLTFYLPDGPLPRGPVWPEALTARGLALLPEDSPARWTSRLRTGIAALATACGHPQDGLRVLSVLFPEGFASAGLSEQDLWTRLLLDGGFERAALITAQARQQLRDSPPARLLLVEALIALDRSAEATEIADGIPSVSAATSVATPLAQALLALAAQDLEGAETAVRAALAIRPDHSQAQALLARVLTAKGEHEEALRVLTDAAHTAQAVNQIELLAAQQALLHTLDRDEEAAACGQVRQTAIDALTGQLATQLEEMRSTGRRPRAAGAAAPAAPHPAMHRAAPAPAGPSAEWVLPAEFDLNEPPDQRLLDALFNHFGYTQFRPGQAAVLRSVLVDERDTLALLPTGQGKSLCFQLPALLLPGVVLVVSPLLALMADQIAGLAEVEALAERSVALNSTLSLDELDRRLAAVAQGGYKLVYVAPERLRQPPLLQALRQVGVSLLVVDEAHCTTIWGHSFRPDYLAIGDAAVALGNPRLLAVTATATPAMQEEIARSLGRPLTVISTGVLRENLSLAVEVHPDKEAKTGALLEFVRRERGSGVIYAGSRDTCEHLARLLRSRGIAAAHYHAGMLAEERAATQGRFMTGAVRVLCATVAFGMGVNKRDIRFIVHFQPARSLEAYVQEAGRAGRDGAPARCVLLVTSGDRGTLTRHAREDIPDLDALRSLYARLRRVLREANGRPINLEELAEGEDDRMEIDIRVGLSYLQRAGFVSRSLDCPLSFTLLLRGAPPPAEPGYAVLASLGVGTMRSTTLPSSALAAALHMSLADLEPQLLTWAAQGWVTVKQGRRGIALTLADPAPAGAGTQLQQVLTQVGDAALARAEALRRYIDAQGCRSQVIARHFGEATPAACGRCDRCLGISSEKKSTATPAKAQKPLSTDEAREVLLATVGGLPFSVGKTGLVRIVRGAAASPIGPDRCPQFGALAAWSGTRVEGLIAELVDLGDLIQDHSGEYPRLVLGEAAREALARLSHRMTAML